MDAARNELLLDMNGCEKWVATKKEWQIQSHALKYYLAGLRVYIYTPAWRQRQVTCKVELCVTAQHVTGDIKGTEVACCIVICHSFNVAAQHVSVTAQYASAEKGHYYQY